MASLVARIQKEIGRKIDDPEKALKILSPILTDPRKATIERVLNHRTAQITCVMEGIYDRGNVSAGMRSLESYGFFTLHVVETQEKFKAANRVTQGADKWMLTDRWSKTTDCVRHLKDSGFRILATHLDTPHEIQDFAFDQPTAIVFGNEKEGISQEMIQAADGLFKIPMLGFTQSFNISVATALTFYHIYLKRIQSGKAHGDLSAEELNWLRLLYYFNTLSSAGQILDQAGI